MILTGGKKVGSFSLIRNISYTAQGSFWNCRGCRIPAANLSFSKQLPQSHRPCSLLFFNLWNQRQREHCNYKQVTITHCGNVKVRLQRSDTKRAGKMAQWVRVHAAQPWPPSVTSKTHGKVEGELTPQSCSLPSQAWWDICAPPH